MLPYPGVVTDTLRVVDLSERQLNVGDRIEPDGVVRSVQQLEALLPEVDNVFYRAEQGMSIIQTTAQGEWPVYIGDSTDLTRKIQVLQALTEYLVENEITPRYVDVRWTDHPVYGKPGG